MSLDRRSGAVIATAIVTVLAGCSEERAPASRAGASPEAGGAPVASAAAAQRAAPAAPPSAAEAIAATAPPPRAEVAAANEGEVLEVVDAGGYTYLRVSQPGGWAWIASGKSAVRTGERVRWGDVALMRNFHSKALQHTFDEIWFVSAVVPAAAPAGDGASHGRGRVVAVLEAPGYTYLEVEADRRRWIAAPATPVSVGDRVAWDGGSTMHGFASKTLNRTFEEIVFVAAITAER